MGEISDIVSVIQDMAKDTKSTLSAISSILKPSNKSISDKSLEGTANFPVLVSDGLDIDDAIMISKALERKFSTFLLTVLTMNPCFTVSGNDTPTASDYLKQFHQNMESFINEQSDRNDIDYEFWANEAMGIAYKIYEGVNYANINSKNTLFNYTIEDVTESSILNNRGINPVLEAKKFNGNSGGTKGGNGGTQKNGNNGGNGGTQKNGRSSNNKTIVNNNTVNPNITVSPNIRVTTGNNQGTRPIRDPKQINYLNNNDLKKANELVPTLLHVRVYPNAVDKNGASTPLDPLDFVIGVKATLHMVSSEDMITNIARGIRNEGLFFNFIRWTTGETKFFKDFLFAIDQQKLDAKNSGRNSDGWWTALKRRRATSLLLKAANNNKSCLPNATLVMTTEDISALREQFGLNLEGADTELVRQLMDRYFLISFVRVNPSLQRVDFLFDGNKHYDTITYSTLSKENGHDDRKFKDMMKMLGRSM